MNKEERSMAVAEAEQVQDGNGVTILDLFNAVRKHVITAVVTLVIVGGNLRVHLYPHSAIHRDFRTLGHLSQFSGCSGRIQQCRRAELWRQLHQ